MNELTYDEYERLSAGGALVPVFREIPGDLKTPVSAFLSLAARSERAFLLESVVGGERLARYSFLGRDPVATLELRGDGLVVRDGQGFREAVLRAKEYIAAGDIFQVVLSRRQSVDCALDPFTVYRALRMVNPSPYMYFLRDGETAIAGASPEMLVRVENRRVETRPLAGTRPR